ncbi:kinase-like domain-containing protein [Xylaria telfairii]|nr:kinase-like domain-containing protein [Xylaria telfairii]
MNAPSKLEAQCPNPDANLEKTSESTNSVPDADGSISYPRKCGAIGSDVWNRADQCSTDSKIAIEARKFFGVVDWHALALIATSCRDGIQCNYVDADGFSVGQFNMVRRLDFIDGVRWVARVRLPPGATPVSPAARGHYDDRREFEVEIASIKFFKSKSTIPVPEVFYYDPNPSNHVGAPYMLLEYIHGSTAEDLQEIENSALGMFGTPEQDRKLRQQMAKIQAQLLAFQFPKIGSLYYDKETESFYIGPDIITGNGPWMSSADYYRDLTDVLMKEAAARQYLNPEHNTYFCAPILLNHLMSICSKDDKGPYSLVNRDFGVHNILVDNDFNIVGVIDLGGVFAATPEAAAQYPVLSCLDIEPPGMIPINHDALQRVELKKPKLAEYREWLMKYEAEFRNSNSTISSLVGSQGAVIYYGLDSCSEARGFQTKTWFSSALVMLKEYTEA